MARYIILVICVLFFLHDITAQTSGKIGFAGITTGLADFSLEMEDVTSVFYHVHPNFGFMVHDNLALGIYFNISNFNVRDYPYTAVGVGPFVRVVLDKVFFQGSIDFGFVTSELFNYHKITISAGYAFHLSKLFALEPQIFYASENNSGRGYEYGGPGIGLGLQFYIHARTKK